MNESKTLMNLQEAIEIAKELQHQEEAAKKNGMIHYMRIFNLERI